MGLVERVNDWRKGLECERVKVREIALHPAPQKNTIEGTKPTLLFLLCFFRTCSDAWSTMSAMVY
jgi:hypothetical protein